MRASAAAGNPFSLAATAHRPWRLMGFFLIVALAISLLGWGAYTSQAEYLRQRQYQELRAIANFKGAQIEDWLAERRADAKSLLASRFARSDFSKWLDRHDATSGERLQARLETLRVYDTYTGIELLDQTGTPSLVVGSARHDPAQLSPAILSAAAKTSEPQLIDLYRNGRGGPIRFAYLLAIPQDDGTAPLGYLRLTIDPEKRLYPLVQSWPARSPSAETLIVRREGGNVVYLNTLRHRENTALDFGIPLADIDLPAAKAAEGREGIFEGTDYRGIEVLSYLRPIAGTPWRMVAKVDRDEVFQSIQEVARLTVAATTVLLLFTGIMLQLWWRRQQMATQLHLRQELERIATVSPGVIFSFCQRPDGSTAISYASPGIREVFGLTPEEVAEDADPFRSRIPPDDNQRLLAARTASAKDLSIWQLEFRYHHPEKGEIWVEEKSVPARQPDGGVIWHGFAYDITERKRAEQSLEESEARFSTVFKESPLGIAISSLDDGTFVEVNDAFLDMFGLTREGVIGHTTGELELWGDLSERSRLVDKMLNEGAIRNAEVKFRHHSGEMLDVLYSAGKIELAGKNFLLSLISDMTTLRQAEQALAASREHYRSLFEHMLEGYALCRMQYRGEEPVDFTFIAVNPAFSKLSGLKDVTGKPVSDIIPGIRDSNPDIFQVYGRVARTGQPERLETYILSLEKWFSIAVFSPEPEYFVTVFDNITERKETEIAMKAHRDRLESEVAARTTQLVAANKELQAFAYAASHDLKAPLRGISGFANLLEREYRDQLEGDGLTYLDHISASASKMATLIDDLLAYARLEQETQQLKRIDLPAAVQSVVADYQEEIRQCGAELRLEMADGTIEADMPGLIQVLRNLLGNALKYSAKADHPLIVIGGEPHSGCYRFWLRDNGVGFDMTYHDQIFEIFRRLHSSREFAGSGVGLALVRKAMERMGGRVWAESAPGQGATFFLEFQMPDR